MVARERVHARIRGNGPRSGKRIRHRQRRLVPRERLEQLHGPERRILRQLRRLIPGHDIVENPVGAAHDKSGIAQGTPRHPEPRSPVIPVLPEIIRGVDPELEPLT